MKLSDKEIAIFKGGNQKHYIIYYHIGTGTYVVTSPRAWARENSKLFPECDFQNNHPTTSAICKLLRGQYSFQTVKYASPKISLTYRLEPLFELLEG